MKYSIKEGQNSSLLLEIPCLTDLQQQICEGIPTFSVTITRTSANMSGKKRKIFIHDKDDEKFPSRLSFQWGKCDAVPY